MVSLEDRFAGTLVGLAVGDALGGPLEQKPIKKPRAPIYKTPLVTEMTQGGWLKLISGQITDDTEMALCLAQSIVSQNKFDPADAANRFVSWFYDSPIGAGGTTKSAMERLRNGIPWYDAANTQIGRDSLGTGHVMKCAPIALAYSNDVKGRIESSKIQSQITHLHPDCIYSAVFINELIAGLLSGKEKEYSIITSLEAIQGNIKLFERYAKILHLQEKDLQVSCLVYDVVENSAHCLMRTGTFEEAIVKAVNMQGDADTRGAVTGALCGAYYGERAIPLRWKDKLVDRHGKKVYGELIDLSLKLYELSLK